MHRVRLKNLGTTDKKSSRKIKYKKIPRVHSDFILPDQGPFSIIGPFLILSYTHESRAGALYCLLTQAVCSLLACQKQMSADAAACFSLRSLYHNSYFLTREPPAD